MKPVDFEDHRSGTAIAERRVLLGVLAACSLIGLHSLARSEAKGAKFRLGLLGFRLTPDQTPIWAVFFGELARLGYEEGRNITLLRQSAASLDYGEFDRKAVELVESQPDVIVAAAGTPSVEAAKRATSSIPIVMFSAVEPVRDGLVASLAHPGGNVTGNALNGIELVVKKLEIIADIVRPQRIAFISGKEAASMRHYEEYQRALTSAAQGFGAELNTYVLGALDELPTVLEEMSRRQTQAVVLDNPALFFVNATHLTEQFAARRVPAIAEGRSFAVAGLPVTYGVDYSDLARKTVGFVDRIFKGAKPKDMPLEQATRFEMVVNLKAAKALGIEIPQRIMLLAQEVTR